MQDLHKDDAMKMYCIVAATSLKAMNGNRGKLAAQAGHAYLHAWWDAIRPRNLTKWDEEKGYNVPDLTIVDNALKYSHEGKAVKVCLVVPDVPDLLPLFDAYKHKTGVSMVTDAGLTCFNEPTTTCLGIGPICEEDIGNDLKDLKVLI